MPRHFYATCRFCGASEFAPERLVKYAVRHYAHHDCYLEAGKQLGDLQPWQVGQFPWRVLREFGLVEEAEQRLAEAVK